MLLTKLYFQGDSGQEKEREYVPKLLQYTMENCGCHTCFSFFPQSILLLNLASVMDDYFVSFLDCGSISF